MGKMQSFNVKVVSMCFNIELFLPPDDLLHALQSG
jgi:hypothetical protein